MTLTQVNSRVDWLANATTSDWLNALGFACLTDQLLVIVQICLITKPTWSSMEYTRVANTQAPNNYDLGSTTMFLAPVNAL